MCSISILRLGWKQQQQETEDKNFERNPSKLFLNMIKSNRCQNRCSDHHPIQSLTIIYPILRTHGWGNICQMIYCYQEAIASNEREREEEASGRNLASHKWQSTLFWLTAYLQIKSVCLNFIYVSGGTSCLFFSHDDNNLKLSAERKSWSKPSQKIRMQSSEEYSVLNFR